MRLFACLVFLCKNYRCVYDFIVGNRSCETATFIQYEQACYF